jgi:hypothetical protein
MPTKDIKMGAEKKKEMIEKILIIKFREKYISLHQVELEGART